MIFRHLLNMRSHPTWVRGLKHTFRSEQRNGSDVAPYVGAWIETTIAVTSFGMMAVAPYVGAWIETKR